MSTNKIWDCPEQLSKLLEELAPMDGCPPKAEIHFIHPEEGTLTLKGEAAGKMLATVDSVDQCLAALQEDGESEDYSSIVEVCNFGDSLDPDVFERLGEYFDYVEEV